MNTAVARQKLDCKVESFRPQPILITHLKHINSRMWNPEDPSTGLRSASCVEIHYRCLYAPI